MIYYAFCNLLHGKAGTSWTGCKSRLLLCRSTWWCCSSFTPLIPKRFPLQTLEKVKQRQQRQRQAKHLFNLFQLPCSTFTNNVLKIREWTLETLDLSLKGCRSNDGVLSNSICSAFVQMKNLVLKNKNGQKLQRVKRFKKNSPVSCLSCLPSGSSPGKAVCEKASACHTLQQVVTRQSFGRLVLWIQEKIECYIQASTSLTPPNQNQIQIAARECLFGEMPRTGLRLP